VVRSKPRQKPADQARKSHAGRWIDLWISVVLTAAIFAVYGQVRNFEFLNLDDPDSFENPHLIHGFTREGPDLGVPVDRLVQLVPVDLDLPHARPAAVRRSERLPSLDQPCAARHQQRAAFSWFCIG
jgi:hypothetical protein